MRVATCTIQVATFLNSPAEHDVVHLRSTALGRRGAVSKSSALALMLLLAAAPFVAVRAYAQTIAITGARIIDGSGAAALPNATIVVDNGRIVAIGAGVAVPRGALRRDYGGRTIIPGLISDHSHVGLVGGIQTGAENYTRANILSQLQQYRRYGVTTVTALGLNGPIFETIRAEAHAGVIGGADLFGVDHGIGVPNGGPPQATLKVAADQLYRPATPQEARDDVRHMAAHKTDLVKLWLDDFGGTAPRMKPEIYQAVIDESHKLGLRVAAHIHDLADAEAIVAAGADILAHGVRDQEVPPEFIAKLKQRGIWYIPTLNLDESTFAWADQAAWTRTAFARAGLSPALAREIDDPSWRANTEAAPATAAARHSLAMNLHNLKLLYDAGVRIGFGTDSGAVALRVPGVAEHRELALMVQAGLSPMQSLTVATRNAAELLGQKDRGILSAGRRADFSVLAADPSQNIAASDDIIEVWEAGRVVPGPLPVPGKYRHAGE
jgi:imidazolonepropionase-like amidohydrolase